MTVSTTESRIGYNGNGVTTIFAVPFRFLENTDLIVTLVDASLNQFVKTLNTDYTVTGAGDDAGGSITMVVAPASGERLIVVRQVPLTQETDYISGDPFPAETHERALDKLTMISQRLESLISRSIRLSDADLLVTSTILPAPSAGASLIWNSTATALVNGIPVEGTLAISPYMEAVLGSVDAADARTNLQAAADAAVVKLTGAQTIADVKTFSSSPVVPTATTSGQAANKGQMDTAISTAVSAAVAPATLAPTLLVAGTSVSASGVAVDIGGIPSWARRVTVLFESLSTTGSSSMMVQIGDAGGIETSGYLGSSGVIGASTAASTLFTTGFGLRTSDAADVISGSVVLAKISGNVWVASGTFGRHTNAAAGITGGAKALSDTLTQIRVTTVGGTDTFDLGSVNVLYE
jgi:hypothetical protein